MRKVVSKAQKYKNELAGNYCAINSTRSNITISSWLFWPFSSLLFPWITGYTHKYWKDGQPMSSMLHTEIFNYLLMKSFKVSYSIPYSSFLRRIQHDFLKIKGHWFIKYLAYLWVWVIFHTWIIRIAFSIPQ